MADDKISFSKEVAETLNIESAIILDKCNQDIFKKIRSKDVLIERLSNELTFIKKEDIKKSLDELLRFNLIKKYQQEDSRSNLRLPRAKPFEKQDMGNGWLPSSEAMDVLEMGSIEESFISKKIPEFRIYWMERGQQRN
ncbi:DnaT-like ssDNA-binding domain-containing protein, partial [Gammaproteobacteria bacterium]|nr:DnaT-like ssDNA-binding domain-containing protein [Gammaproteobacteria bacterium]